MAPIGAYFLIMACTLTFRAAFRYFSDSVRSDDDKWDMPIKSREASELSQLHMEHMNSYFKARETRTVQGVASPEQLFHVLGHDSRHVLQVVVQSVQL